MANSYQESAEPPGQQYAIAKLSEGDCLRDVGAEDGACNETALVDRH